MKRLSKSDCGEENKMNILNNGRTTIISILILIVLFFAPTASGSEKKGLVLLSASYFGYSDSRHKEVYSSGNIYPEIKVGFKTYRDFYLWGSYGFLTADGVTPVLEEATKINYHHMSIGGGYSGNFSERLVYLIELGLFYVNYREKAMGEEVSGSSVGFRIGGGIIFNISKVLFTEVSVGYLHAQDKVEDITLKLGGFKAGIGFGIRY